MEMLKKLVPVVGHFMHFFNDHKDSKPQAALVTEVHESGHVNLLVTTPTGAQYPMYVIPVVRAEDETMPENQPIAAFIPPNAHISTLPPETSPETSPALGGGQQDAEAPAVEQSALPQAAEK